MTLGGAFDGVATPACDTVAEPVVLASATTPPSLGTLALVALGGAAGATARALVGRRLDGRRATVAVNVAGSWLLGVVAGVVATGGLPSSAAALVGTGFCGAFTTFSSLAVETRSLLVDREWRTALRFGGGTLLAALLGAAVGGWLVG